jgi:glycosyltransferase involved in cell wall biosynthesis
LKILHTVASLWEGSGGPVAAVTSLCAGLAARGHELTLLTGAGPLHPAVLELRSRVRLRTEPLGPYRAANWSPAFRAACLEEARRADLIHDYGLWLHTNWSSVRMAGRAGRPVVRSPMGMLSAWALQRSRLRKRLVWSLIERRLFDDAALVHSTSEMEERDVKRLRVVTRTVVIPHGVDLEREYAVSSVAAARKAGVPETDGRRVVLFLSRIHPVKGLDLLRRVWAELPTDLPALLLIAGPGDEASLTDLRRWLVEQPGPPARYVGPVTGERKLALLSSAWVMALPSYSENYGMVVAEALACGTPVLTTTGMPWAEVAATGCGWVIEPRIGSLRRALQEALGLAADEHEPMRARARALVDRSHSLERAVTRMEESYEAVVKGAGLRSAATP